MKTALLLTGQPRYVLEHYPAIKNNLIEPNSADVYIHMWTDPNLSDKPFRSGKGWINERLTKNAESTVNELYKPKTIKIELQKSFPILDIDFTNTLKNNMGGGAEIPDVKQHYIFATQSMWYSIKQCFNLLSESYDAVILTRFDLSVSSRLSVDQYDLNRVWGQDIGRPELLLNWMNFGSFDKMNLVFGQMYDRIVNLYNETNVWCNEYWCKYICDKTGINIGLGNWGLGIPSRNL